jgi:putative transposase
MLTYICQDGRVILPTQTERHLLAMAPSLLGQQFLSPVPSRILLVDITYIATSEGWLYLAAILDLATRRIVGPPQSPDRGPRSC